MFCGISVIQLDTLVDQLPIFLPVEFKLSNETSAFPETFGVPATIDIPNLKLI